ncbi:MAG: hypothetical protein HT580_06890 [Dechloromonas sp.]|nr:MAG: hypothetical protein HT580_06890 [Dechloromonas sp.]
MNLSHLVTAFALVVPLAAIAQNAQHSQDFKKRFQAADVDKDGKLTRTEAYAAFPLMPQYFDEIDVNRDGSITMVEVDAAMNKRVDAALAASKTASGRYALPQEAAGLSGPATAGSSSVLVDHDEAKVFHGRQYYDSLAGDLAQEQMRGEPVPRNPAPDQFQKSF